MTTRRLILASASPRRLELLGQIGITPDLVSPTHIDETQKPDEKPEKLVARLAIGKALACHEDGVVLAADTIVICGGKVLGKPTDEADARSMLKHLSGRRHRVTTSIAVRDGKNLKTRSVSTKVKFKNLSQVDIAQYIASMEWQDKAGGYAIQGLAGRFVISINGSYSNVVGLPLCETANLLNHFGIRCEG
jgi:septum formation protein